MIKKIGLNLLGVLVGLLIIGGGWAAAMGIAWIIAMAFKFVFALLPIAESIVFWICILGGTLFILILCWGIGNNVVKGLISK
jgi:hypothetical protein